jgi:NAD(P)-dependent dehydrogenase (short-subunit alcohol dehydrogenase family)
MRPNDFSQTVALITGSAGGLGKEFAYRLLKGGAHVCLSDVNPQLGNETLTKFKNEFGSQKVHFVECDVTSKQDWKRLVVSTRSKCDQK